MSFLPSPMTFPTSYLAAMASGIDDDEEDVDSFSANGNGVFATISSSWIVLELDPFAEIAKRSITKSVT
jgi:hypothetical protein